MVQQTSNKMTLPVVKAVTYFLAHVPNMIRHGSKPSRDIPESPALLENVLSHLNPFEEAVVYPPNQVFIGNLDPDDLMDTPTPWYQNGIADASRQGPFGEIMPEEEFYGMMKICDEFDLLLLKDDFLKAVASRLQSHPLITEGDLQKLLKQKFKAVANVKPPSSRADSSEKFVVATGFRG